MKVKELIKKYPKILDMNVNGLEFIQEDDYERHIEETITSFTEITKKQEKELTNLFIKLIPFKFIFQPQEKVEGKIVAFYKDGNNIMVDDWYNNIKENVNILSDLHYYSTNGEDYKENGSKFYLNEYHIMKDFLYKIKLKNKA